MKHFKSTILILAASIFFTSCGSDSIKSLITKFSKEDRVIDSAECEKLKDYIIDNKNQYKDLFVNDKLDENKFIDYINNFLKNELRNADDVKLECQKQEHPTINIFIENSGSMDGYINGNTIYKSNLSDLIVQSRGIFGIKNINTFFVNSDTYKVDSEDVKKFISKIKSNSEEYKQGNTSTSELNETLKLVLSKTNDNSISILLSDFIYSLDKGQNTQDGLGIGKSLTKDAFLQQLSKFDFSTLILKFNSDFNGKYYSYDNSVKNFQGQRPYYLLIIGKDGILRNYIKQIKLSNLKGFENSYLISNSDNFKPTYEVFDSKTDIGSSRYSRDSSKDNLILDKVKAEDGTYQFTVAVDFSDFPDQKILRDKSNYNITGDFEIIAINDMTDSFINENYSSSVANKVKQSNTTHFITLKSIKPNFDKKLAVQLTNKQPLWITASSTDNDLNISTDKSKTFGFNYFVDGIYEAYNLKNNNTNNNLVNLTFTLNK